MLPTLAHYAPSQEFSSQPSSEARNWNASSVAHELPEADLQNASCVQDRMQIVGSIVSS